ncbi:uncharacterized protein LOC132942853 [Metopolophium dirhodum]|uniref:uncharacterized protein LOC132942853 n=1 Tax=Metopolophium dirhodum TaxID=44670 RepID=UPI00298F7DE4|nr:uncharacterized protein LOC132942853 [Metopolophium dirhodum]
MTLVGFLLICVAVMVRPGTAATAADPFGCANRFEVHDDKIIRTEDSKKLGAKFIDSVEQHDRAGCLELCCRTSRCDVFVFEEKSPGTCYLFECGPSDDFKCKFTNHKNYSSALMLSRHASELENQIKLTQIEHEHELIQLKKLTSFTTPSTTVLPISAINKETEITIPQDKHSERTPRCSRYQFECKTSSECIAIYNACDGIPQCSDGSDEALELACPTTPSKQVLMKDANYGLAQGNNYIQTLSNKPMDITGQQVNQPIQQYQWKNQQPIFSSNVNYNNAKVDKPAYSSNFASSQYGREGEGLKWTSQDMVHQNYANNRIFTHVNGGVLPDYNRQQNNLLQNNMPSRVYNAEPGMNIDHNYNHLNNMNHEFHHFNTGGKTNYQNQNNPDYFYEDLRPKMEQSNTIPQPGSDYQRQIQLEVKKSETLLTEKPVITQKHNLNETSTQSTTTDSHLHRKLVQPLTEDSIVREVYFESSDDGYAIMPNGAFISLILGVIASSIMIIVIGCRLRVMRNRHRKGSKQSYAHDADFLINGMYL